MYIRNIKTVNFHHANREKLVATTHSIARQEFDQPNAKKLFSLPDRKVETL